MRRLLVTADDLGLSREVNAGVLRAYCEGIVTSASVLVGGRYAREAVEMARPHPELSLGLHLAFVQGQPILSPEQVPSLTRKDGSFRPTAFHLLASRPCSSELDREAEAQMQAFIELVGAKPAFVNTHQHTQLLPRVLGAVLRLCDRHEVRAVRLPAERRPFRLAVRPRGWLWPLATVAARLGRRRLSRAGLRHPDGMLGGPDSGRLTKHRLQALIGQLPCGTMELVVHPAEGSQELEALIDPSIAQALDEAGVVRIAFDGL